MKAPHLLPVLSMLSALPFVMSSSSTDELDSLLNQPFAESVTKLQHAPCTTLFYRDGRVGCGTQDRSTQVGELVYFGGSSSSLSADDRNEPYVAVMEDYMLTAKSINTLLAARKNGGQLQGILVLNATDHDGDSDNDDANESNAHRSPDAQAPQGYGTPSEQISDGGGTNNNAYAWNSKGEGLFQYDLYGLPMAYVLDSDVSAALRSESKQAKSASSSKSSSRSTSSVVADFNYYMGMDGIDSKQCLAWKDAATGDWMPKCLPLGGTSVWASPGSPASSSSSSGSSSSGDGRPVIMVAGSMDATSMFHDVAPGANTAASNILTLLMAAKLIGDNVDDDTLDGLTGRIVFALFQGESFGFVGSRSFLRDVYSKFSCNGSPVRSVYRMGDKSDYACLNPVRPSLAFADLGTIAGMISVDQVGHEVASGLLYVHADNNNDNFGSFLSNVMLNSGTSSVSVAKASVNNNGNGYPYPPTPLTSLLSVSQGAVGGAVLTGYDYAFTTKVPYNSHMDSATVNSIKVDSIAGAATILARAAVAAAYDGASNYDYETASAYAANLIPELSDSDSTLIQLAKCFYQDASCSVIKKYANTEMANERARTGLGLGNGAPFDSNGRQPNYFAGVYNGYYGQPFAQVGDGIYGAYAGKDYGKKQTDAVGLVPRQLSSAIRGMMNDFLGRGKIKSSGGNAVSCNKLSDCDDVEYCPNGGETATCTGGGVCVCGRAHYHVALDEALQPAADMPTGYFEVSSSDEGITPMWTEPYWSNDVGVRIYRAVGWMPGFFTLVAGLAAAGLSMFGAFVLKIGLRKEKLY